MMIQSVRPMAAPAPRFGAGKLPEVNEQNFDSEVLQSKIPVLVDFYATWCPPCRAVTPVLEDLAKDFQGKAKVVKVNIDDNPNLAVKYNISSIPTMIVFKNGQPMPTQNIGYSKKSVFADMLNKALP